MTTRYDLIAIGIGILLGISAIVVDKLTAAPSWDDIEEMHHRSVMVAKMSQRPVEEPRKREDWEPNEDMGDLSGPSLRGMLTLEQSLGQTPKRPNLGKEVHRNGTHIFYAPYGRYTGK
jgi:hypothetical protein